MKEKIDTFLAHVKAMDAMALSMTQVLDEALKQNRLLEESLRDRDAVIAALMQEIEALKNSSISEESVEPKAPKVKKTPKIDDLTPSLF